MGKYTVEERTAAQQHTFYLKKNGCKATRIVEKAIDGYDKNEKPIYVNVLTSFGYSKDRSIPREINQEDVDKYEFEFIYHN